MLVYDAKQIAELLEVLRPRRMFIPTLLGDLEASPWRGIGAALGTVDLEGRSIAIVDITLDLYSHEMPRKQADAAEQVDAASQAAISASLKRK